MARCALAAGATAAVAAALVALALRSGGESEPAPQDWPPGTVLAVDDMALSQAEIDRVAGWVARLEPAKNTILHRRQALTALVLPRAATQVREPEARAAAIDRAAAWLAYERGEGAAPLDDGPPAPAGQVSGSWKELGFEIWGPVTELPLGVWSEVEEGIGTAFVVRVDAHEPDESIAVRDRWTISLRQEPYLPPDTDRAGLAALVDACELSIVDPAWDEVVPAEWKYRMRGEDR